MAHGYLLVLRTPEPVLQIPQEFTRYRGIDRVPPVLNYPPKDFNDPLLYEDVTDDSGLIPTLDQAVAVMNGFLPLYASELMEIVYVDSDLEPIPSGMDLMGWDVAAAGAPFYSVVRYLYYEPSLTRYVDLLNNNGLFINRDDAVACLRDYLNRLDRDLTVNVSQADVWSVMSVAVAETR